jgi:hypothetical protein
MQKRVIRRSFAALLMLLLFACSQEPSASKGEDVTRPEFVYVPAENYKISVDIAVPREAVAGEWITLRATRTSGPWKLIKASELAPGTTWFIKPPPEHEREVADNLRWLTEPPGAARFDVPVHAIGPISHERKAVFRKPGTYRLRAHNAYPTEAESNSIMITVVPGK